MIKKIFLLGLFFQFLHPTHTFAQTAPIVYMEIVSGHGVNEDSNEADSSTVLKGTFVIALQDTSTISKIHVKLGSSEGGSNFFTKDYDFNPAGEYQDGTSLRKEDLKLYIGIGTYTGLNHFYAEAVIEDTSGTLSQPLRYSR